jgi:cell division protein FtsL
MVALVESMLSLNKQLAAANTGHEKTSLQRQIDATDRQIDQLVYELYGLTDEEIAIVETANKAGQ